MKINRVCLYGLISILLITTSCVSRPPKEVDDICNVFGQKRGWHSDAVKMERRWSVPLHVPMAIIYQESRFVANAKPARNYALFGLIPWGRKSSAYGYAQAIDGTWNSYIKATGNRGADRNDFHDAIDFVGWYVSETRNRNNVNVTDAYKQYLNYHEGWVGYNKRTHLDKQWLLSAAKKVDHRSKIYAKQYLKCKVRLSEGFWYRLLH